MGAEPNLPIVDYTPPTATILAFDSSRQYTDKGLKETDGVIKRKVACKTCRSARAKCDADVKYPCSKCAKKGCPCELPPPKEREKSNSSRSSPVATGELKNGAAYENDNQHLSGTQGWSGSSLEFSANQAFGREFSYGLSSPPPYSTYPDIQTPMTYGTPAPTYTQSQTFNNWNYSGNGNSHLITGDFLQATQHGLANSNVPRAYY